MWKLSLPSCFSDWTAATLGLFHLASLCSSLSVPGPPIRLINPPSLNNDADRNSSFPITYTTLEEVFRNTTTTLPGGIHCFTGEDEHVNPTSPQACKWTQDYVLRRDFPTMPLDVQHFAYKPAPEGWHGVPDQWVVQWRETPQTYPCRIVVASREKTDEDSFSLLNIASAAQTVIDVCLVPNEKGKRGGLMPVGRTRAFFVAVDGFGPVASNLDSSALSRR